MHNGRSLSSQELIALISKALSFRPDNVPYLITHFERSLEQLLGTSSSEIPFVLKEVHSMIEKYFSGEKTNLKYAHGVIYDVSDLVESGQIKGKSAFLDYIRTRFFGSSGFHLDEEEDRVKKPNLSLIARVFGAPYNPPVRESTPSVDRVFSKIDARYEAEKAREQERKAG